MYDKQWVTNTIKVARANLTKCETLLDQGNLALRKATKLHGLDRVAMLKTAEREFAKMIACEHELRLAIHLLSEQRNAGEFAAKNSVEVE